MSEKILFKHIDDAAQHRIDTYMRNGGYQAINRIFKGVSPDEVVEIVKKSGLRGRGGAGFPTGLKWGFVPRDTGKPTFLICNADEGEPGTFKDRWLIEKDPHQLIEGIIIAGFAVRANLAFIYIRGEFAFGAERLASAIQEARDKGFLGKDILNSGYDLEIRVYRGGGAYICGEETSLLNSIEGVRALSRLKPPFPASVGLFKNPTVINNVETLSNLSHIILNGSQWYRNFGTEKSPGTKIFSLSGHVNQPGNYELPLGTALETLIYEHGGGIKDKRNLKAVIPGGISTQVLGASDVDVKLDYESLCERGSQLGSGAVMVMDETTCMVKIAHRATQFFKHESCGKCSPCREGTYWMEAIIRRIENGEGKPQDIDLLLDISDNINGNTVCPLGDGAVIPVTSTIGKFRAEYEHHIEKGKCPFSLKERFK